MLKQVQHDGLFGWMLTKQGLAAFVAAIASREPAPGAGAAGAAALALGIACARKAAAITLKHHEACAELERMDARLASLGEAAFAAGDRDATAFEALIHHQPGAAGHLVEHGRAVLDLVDEAQALVAELDDRVDAGMRGDLIAANALILAARTIARHNLAENKEAGP